MFRAFISHLRVPVDGQLSAIRQMIEIILPLQIRMHILLPFEPGATEKFKEISSAYEVQQESTFRGTQGKEADGYGQQGLVLAAACMSARLAYPDLALHSSDGKFLDLELIFVLIMRVFLELKLGPRARKSLSLMLISLYVAAMVSYSILWKPRLVIVDPELMKEILSDKLGHFGKPPLNPLVLSKGLAFQEGEGWTKHSRMINPAFHLEKLLGGYRHSQSVVAMEEDGQSSRKL
ncbi:hypothetical protein POTOM_025592 [Populus tomentosa]|uniref:Uncharacterized protein n=1 Tax=Populus tomentosa TaxID=118781 RepID=A0A8X8CXC3_POPTO|nr:hypothetical protein POTOM_025592 [Populus tomentosa]